MVECLKLVEVAVITLLFVSLDVIILPIASLSLTVISILLKPTGCVVDTDDIIVVSLIFGIPEKYTSAVPNSTLSVISVIV